MRWGRVMDVARKEVLSTIRDHRALVSNILLPLILLPVIMLGMPLLLGGLFEREATTVTQLGVAGAENMPATLRAAIEAQNVELVPVADPEAAVRDDEVPAAIAVPERFAEEIAAGGKAEVRVYGKSGNMRSELNASKLQAAVSAYQRSVVAERLGAEGLDPSILEPVAVTQVDASTEADRSSGMLSWLIPFFIAIWTLTGGQMTAIDATAGEKERGTLESLLFSPVPVGELFLAKVLAAFLPATALTWGTFLLTTLTVNAVAWPWMGRVFFPTPNWLPLLLLVIPLLSLATVFLTVFVSARVSTFQAAYQLGGVLVLPVLALVVGNMTGLLFLSTPVIAAIGVGLAVVDLLMLLALRRYLDRAQLFESQVG